MASTSSLRSLATPRVNSLRASGDDDPCALNCSKREVRSTVERASGLREATVEVWANPFEQLGKTHKTLVSETYCFLPSSKESLG